MANGQGGGDGSGRGDTTPLPLLTVRGLFAGLLMGLANLVPGISGGTMLLAAGVYPRFIQAVAEITTLRFRIRSLLLLATVVASAALVILLLAGVVRDLVVDHRWVMYSLSIGLTLGGIPVVWAMARPATRGVWAGAAVGFAVMVVLAPVQRAETSAGGTGGVLLGLLVGAVVGLWPFVGTVDPVAGETVIKGRVVTQENKDGFAREDYPTEPFRPTAGQIAGAIGPAALGFLATSLIARLGGESSDQERSRGGSRRGK